MVDVELDGATAIVFAACDDASRELRQRDQPAGGDIVDDALLFRPPLAEAADQPPLQVHQLVREDVPGLAAGEGLVYHDDLPVVADYPEDVGRQWLVHDLDVWPVVPCVSPGVYSERQSSLVPDTSSSRRCSIRSAMSFSACCRSNMALTL
jgi:hypothetical protein